MYSDFDRKHTKQILGAMVLQFHGDCPEALPAQHAQCAPIIRDCGSPEEKEALLDLEAKMRAAGLLEG